MKKNKIIYDGLCCKVNAKAAFVDMCLQTPQLSSKILVSAVIRAKTGNKVYPVGEEKEGIITMRMELDEERREQIYEDVFGRRLSSGGMEMLTEAQKRALEPIEAIHQKKIRIDVIPFLVYGIVRNSRSRNMLEKSMADCGSECMDAFRLSKYNSMIFLRKFLLEERRAVKAAAGLLILTGKEKDEKKYRMVMDIIYAGYRTVKNTIKKLKCLEGEQYKEALARNQSPSMELANMVIQLVTAEDLGIPIISDYQFCQVVHMLQEYEIDWLHDLGQEIDMEDGKRIYRRFLQEHWDPGRCYVSAFLEDQDNETDLYWEQIEKLLYQFGIEVTALAGMSLEKWEAEMLCAVFGERDWEKYKYLLLTATLCKYIQQIEAMYENEIPEEAKYRKSCEEKIIKGMKCEIKCMEEKISCLKQQKEDKERKLSEAAEEIERLKREGAKREEKILKLRESAACMERVKNRQNRKTGVFCVSEEEEQSRKTKVFCASEEEEQKEDTGNGEKVFDAGTLDRSIVIGGHRNWQKKMRKCLPGSQFLASDYMHFDPAVLRNKKYIIVNTDILKHGLYYKIMSERKKEQKVLYVHGNNINRTLREIAEQL